MLCTQAGTLPWSAAHAVASILAERYAAQGQREVSSGPEGHQRLNWLRWSLADQALCGLQEAHSYLEKLRTALDTFGGVEKQEQLCQALLPDRRPAGRSIKAQVIASCAKGRDQTHRGSEAGAIWPQKERNARAER